MKRLHAFAMFVSLAAPLHAQTIDDGIMLAKRELLTANLYSRDSWNQYWEGTLKRENGNIGTVTTNTNVWSANYGVSDRLNIIAMVPYVWTNASQGILHGIQGFQDLTIAGKYDFFSTTLTGGGSLRAIAVASAGVPLTDYNIELPPLSIGNGSARVSGRGTVNFQSRPGWFLNGTTAYTWLSDVTLDRPYYYTEDRFVMSDQVDMPNTFGYVASAGYLKRGLMASFSYSQHTTLGGGDIRRQDMPFVSNRMNFSRIGGMLMAPIPKLDQLAFEVAVAWTITGRNVGHATTLAGGILYTFQKRQIQ